MARKARETRNMDEFFATIPELPKEFTPWCYSFLKKMPIYYKRKGKKAQCQCGKCGREYIVDAQPLRNEPATCKHCGNEGFYEWTSVTRRRSYERAFFIVQCTTDGNIVVRYFYMYQSWKQGHKANIELDECKRLFLTLGDVYWFKYEYHWYDSKYAWSQGKGGNLMDGKIYEGWKQEIQKSCLKYCDVDAIQQMTHRAKINILIAFSNNPAIEMYVKAGMKKTVELLMWKEGKTKQINRRGKSLKAQLKLKDKGKINRFIASEGDITLLEILQMEEKAKTNYTLEQEEFLREKFTGFYNKRKEICYLLNFMTLQQLMNRIKKYQCQDQRKYYKENDTIREYYDYLKMRQELGYDMTNEVYIHPRNLKEKHDEMVKEQNERKDELHIAKKKKQFPDIEKRYEKLCKKYSYESEEYIIRPAKDAGEIIMEGRILHHCVGGDNYLSKHNGGESTILFLRKKESPNKPYYTIEIKDKEIVQWYGIRDSKPDKETIGPWLDKYVNNLKNSKKVQIDTTKQVLQAAG